MSNNGYKVSRVFDAGTGRFLWFESPEGMPLTDAEIKAYGLKVPEPAYLLIPGYDDDEPAEDKGRIDRLKKEQRAIVARLEAKTKRAMSAAGVKGSDRRYGRVTSDE